MAIRQEQYPQGSEMYELMSQLFPICRSLTGEGVRQTLKKLKDHIPLRVQEIPSGEKVFDWNIPREWNISDAYILNESGEKIVDFKKNNLHVVGYSVPIDREISLDELEKHLFSLPEQPRAIPYITSYYHEMWGFCLAYEEREKLRPGKYRVKIDSTLAPGSMTYADLLVPGRSKREILISTYICHPSMANNELSGPILSTFLAKALLARMDLHYSYRFAFVPETIGSIAYISKNLETLKQNTAAGLVVTCAGDSGEFSYLKSKREETLIDKTVLHVLKCTEKTFKVYDFTERGSDERQYSSPGVDLEVGSLMRTKYWEYPEYHTSLDNMDLMSPESLQQSLDKYLLVIEALELNHKYVTQCICEPQLGKRGLYPTTSTKETAGLVKNMMNVLAYCDGRHDLIDIAEKCGVFVLDLKEIVQDLEKHELIRKASEQ